MSGAQGRFGPGAVSSLVVVVGLAREARILGPKVGAAVISGGRPAGLADKLEVALGDAVSGILSFGLCGGLDPTLRPGDLLIATGVTSAGGSLEVDAAWTGRLSAMLPDAARGVLAGAESFLVDRPAKHALRAATGAVAADTESYIAATVSQDRRLPFAAVRAVSDGASRALPRAAQVGLRPDGRADVGAVLASLAAEPWQLPALIRTALEAEAGFRALRRAWRLMT
jgi:hopanoid-associated phosphorylase